MKEDNRKQFEEWGVEEVLRRLPDMRRKMKNDAKEWLTEQREDITEKIE